MVFALLAWYLCVYSACTNNSPSLCFSLTFTFVHVYVPRIPQYNKTLWCQISKDRVHVNKTFNTFVKNQLYERNGSLCGNRYILVSIRQHVVHMKPIRTYRFRKMNVYRVIRWIFPSIYTRSSFLFKIDRKYNSVELVSFILNYLIVKNVLSINLIIFHMYYLSWCFGK